MTRRSYSKYCLCIYIYICLGDYLIESSPVLGWGGVPSEPAQRKGNLVICCLVCVRDIVLSFRVAETSSCT